MGFVIYTRVSTKKQGASGLGLEAQLAICRDFIARSGGEEVAHFKDVESGTHRDRPGLWAAIDYCKSNNCELVIAKLDRLARDVEFTFKVIRTGIQIHFCDMPIMNTMVLGVFASVAQYERELCSSRTKSALREIKEETGLDVKNIEYLFSSPNVYMYSGMGVHTLDMDFLVRVHGGSVAVKAADDAAEALWIPINEVNPAEFGLTSIRNAVIRFLAETLRK